MMKILLVAHSCEPGRGSEAGAGYATLRAAAERGEVWLLTRANNVALVEAGLAAAPPAHPVHVVGLDGAPWLLSLKKRFGAHRLYNAWWQRLVAQKALRLHDDVQFDLVHHATLASYWMPMAALRIPRPVVVQAGGAETVPRTLLRFIGWRETVQQAIRVAARAIVGRTTWAKRPAGHPTVLIAQNDDMAAFAKTSWLADHLDDVMVFPNASDPDLDDWRSDPAERQPVVLFVGHLGRHKGTHLAVEAFGHVARDDARLVLVGGGADPALVRKIERSGLFDRVRLTGRMPRPEVLAQMNRASVLIAPFLRDSAGFVVSEALSVGLPVVALDHAGPASLARLWPADRSDLVPVTDRRSTIAGLTAALERRLAAPAPVADRLRPASRRLTDVVEDAYQRALGLDVRS